MNSASSGVNSFSSCWKTRERLFLVHVTSMLETDFINHKSDITRNDARTIGQDQDFRGEISRKFMGYWVRIVLMIGYTIPFDTIYIDRLIDHRSVNSWYASVINGWTVKFQNEWSNCNPRVPRLFSWNKNYIFLSFRKKEKKRNYNDIFVTIINILS